MLHSITPVKLQAYLAAALGRRVEAVSIHRLSGPVDAGDEKTYGYGDPLRIDYTLDGQPRRAVLHTMKPNRFGHEHRADRAAILLWSHDAFNRLPRHVASLNVGAFDRRGDLVPLHDIDEVFLLTEYVEGTEYARDLHRLRDGAALTDLDLARADALCDYLLQIHQRRGTDPPLYTRRVRELIGHGECIMGLIDSYPRGHWFIAPALLESIERKAVAWRWRIKDRTHRLCQVHGDFHPWNILFGDGAGFHVLDRSRGEWGEPADDVTSITLNYVFESVQATGRVEGAFATLFDRFWQRYLAAGDRELLEVAPPFIAWRGLVMASPVWYPQLRDESRRKLFNMIEAVLDAPAFEPGRMNEYLDGVGI
jgi:streptomycin 6-kinase